MAWNDKGGGPWGSPPGGGEPRRPPSNDRGGPSPSKGPNDFEAMLRQIQDWLGHLPGLGGGIGVLFLVAAHMALVAFSPVLSSATLADAISRRVGPGDSGGGPPDWPSMPCKREAAPPAACAARKAMST